MVAETALRRPLRIVTATLALFLTFEAAAAEIPVAAALGPTVSVGTPSAGYVGRLTLAPDHGPVGTPVTSSLRS